MGGVRPIAALAETVQYPQKYPCAQVIDSRALAEREGFYFRQLPGVLKPNSLGR